MTTAPEHFIDVGTSEEANGDGKKTKSSRSSNMDLRIMSMRRFLLGRHFAGHLRGPMVGGGADGEGAWEARVPPRGRGSGCPPGGRGLVA